MRLCAVPECGREAHAREWCLMHYKRWKRNGAPVIVRVRATCAIPGCGHPAVGRGWCRRHYTRWRTYGDPLKLVRSAKNEGHVFLGVHGYMILAVGKRRYQLHRVMAEALAHRPLLHSEVVHHKDGNKLNNVAENYEIMLNGRHTSLHHGLGLVGVPALNAAKTHCKHGHPLSGTNLVLPRDGSRQCRVCKNARERGRRARLRSQKHPS